MKRDTRVAVLFFLLGSVGALCVSGCDVTAPTNSGGNNTANPGGTVYSSTLPPFATPPAQRNPAPGQKAGPASIYPNPTLTPGDVFPGVTAREVCVSGYSKSVRSVSSAEKAAVYQRYGIANLQGAAEVDHFISLELGGSNQLTNLWPRTV